MDQRINFPVAKALSDRGFLVMSEDCFYIKDEKIIESKVTLACEEEVFYYLRPTVTQVLDFLKLFNIEFIFSETRDSIKIIKKKNSSPKLYKRIKKEEFSSVISNILISTINSIDLKDN